MLSESEKPINPERRDPGSIRKKAEIGLGKVDNFSSIEYQDIILDLTKNKINEFDIYDLNILENPITKKEIGICTFNTRSAAGKITLGLFNDINNLLEVIKLEFIYNRNFSPNKLEELEYKTEVSSSTTYLLGSKFLFIRNNNETCNLILSLPKESSEIKKIGVNIFEFTEGIKKVDSSLVNSYFSDNFDIISEVKCNKTYLSSNYLDSSIGLAVFDKSGKYVRVDNGKSFTSDEIKTYNFPKINGTPFLGHLNLTDNFNKPFGRNITITSKHPGTSRTEAGIHDWEVLNTFPKFNLIPGDTGSSFEKTMSIEDGYGLCKIDNYSYIPLDPSNTGDIMIGNLSNWINNLNNYSNVVSVGQFQEAIFYITEILRKISGGSGNSVRYSFNFINSSSGSISFGTSGGSSTIEINSKKIEISGGGTEEISNQHFDISSVSPSDAIQKWGWTIEVINDPQELRINVPVNETSEIRRLIIDLTQSETGKKLTCNVVQNSGSIVYGFRFGNGDPNIIEISDRIFISRDSVYDLLLDSQGFINKKVFFYPVMISNGVESRIPFSDIDEFRFEDDPNNNWLGLMNIPVINVDPKNSSSKIVEGDLFGAAWDNTLESRHSFINIIFKDYFFTINAIQNPSSEYLTINGNPGILPVSINIPAISNPNYITIPIDSNSSWRIVNTSVVWLTFDKNNGSSGREPLKITFQPNTTTSPRAGEILIVGNTIQRTVKFLQGNSDSYLKFDNQNSNIIHEFNYSQQSKSVKIETNLPWTAETDSSWIILSQISGPETGPAGFNFNYQILENTTISLNGKRTGKIIIEIAGLKREIEINQTNPSQKYIIPEIYNIQIPDIRDSNLRYFKVYSNSKFKTTTNDSWIGLDSNFYGSSGEIIQVQIAYSISSDNSSVNERIGKINLVNEEGVIVDIVRITQVGRKLLELSNSSVSFLASGNNKEITIKSNKPWSYEISYSLGSNGWIKNIQSPLHTQSDYDNSPGKEITDRILIEVDTFINDRNAPEDTTRSAEINFFFYDTNGNRLTKTLFVTQSKNLVISTTVNDVMAVLSREICSKEANEPFIVHVFIKEHILEYPNGTGMAMSSYKWRELNEGEYNNTNRLKIEFMDIDHGDNLARPVKYSSPNLFAFPKKNYPDHQSGASYMWRSYGVKVTIYDEKLEVTNELNTSAVNEFNKYQCYVYQNSNDSELWFDYGESVRNGKFTINTNTISSKNSYFSDYQIVNFQFQITTAPNLPQIVPYRILHQKLGILNDNPNDSIINSFSLPKTDTSVIDTSVIMEMGSMEILGGSSYVEEISGDSIKILDNENLISRSFTIRKAFRWTDYLNSHDTTNDINGSESREMFTDFPITQEASNLQLRINPSRVSLLGVKNSESLVNIKSNFEWKVDNPNIGLPYNFTVEADKIKIKTKTANVSNASLSFLPYLIKPLNSGIIFPSEFTDNKFNVNQLVLIPSFSITKTSGSSSVDSLMLPSNISDTIEFFIQSNCYWEILNVNSSNGIYKDNKYSILNSDGTTSGISLSGTENGSKRIKSLIPNKLITDVSRNSKLEFRYRISDPQGAIVGDWKYSTITLDQSKSPAYLDCTFGGKKLGYYSGDTLELEIDSNTTWNIQLNPDSSYPNWISLDRNSGSSIPGQKQWVIVKAEKDSTWTDLDRYIANLFITGTGASSTSINVYQKRQAPNIYSLSGERIVLPPIINSDVMFSFSSNYKWWTSSSMISQNEPFTFSPKSGNIGGTNGILVSSGNVSNTSTSEKQLGNLTVISGWDEDNKKEISVEVSQRKSYPYMDLNEGIGVTVVGAYSLSPATKIQVIKNYESGFSIQNRNPSVISIVQSVYPDFYIKSYQDFTSEYIYTNTKLGDIEFNLSDPLDESSKNITKLLAVYQYPIPKIEGISEINITPSINPVGSIVNIEFSSTSDWSVNGISPDAYFEITSDSTISGNKSTDSSDKKLIKIKIIKLKDSIGYVGHLEFTCFNGIDSMKYQFNVNQQ